MKKTPIIAIVFVALTVSILCAQDGGSIIKRIVIEGEDPSHAEQIKRIIPLKEGEELDVTDMARTASLLRKTGLYKEINIVYERLPEGGINITIQIVPHRFIRRIKFKNAFPVFDTELRDTIRAREGMAYDERMISEDVVRIEAFLQEQGYFESEVRVQLDVDHETGDAIVTFIIDKKGTRYTVGRVSAEGNEHLSDFAIWWEVRKKMPIWYRKDKVEEATGKIVERYHNKGYYEATVKSEGVEIDPAIRTVHLPFDISEGRRTIVEIRGNRHITDNRLKREMTFSEMEAVDEFEIADSAQNMADLYRSRGYMFVEIDWDADLVTYRDGRKVMEITYRVTEGPQVTVGEVIFNGAESFKDRKLKKQMITGRRRSFFRSSLLVEDVLVEDIRAIETFYRNNGYEEIGVATAEITFNRRRTDSTVVIQIDEGPRTTVRDVTFEGVEFFTREMMLAELQLTEGKPFDSSILAMDKRRLLVLYADWGYPYARVSQKTERGTDEYGGKYVTIHYSVVEGKRVEIGETIIRGNYETKGRVLTREIEVNGGEPFSYTGVLQSRRNLRTLPFLYTVKLETLGLEERMSVVHLLLNVRERPTSTLDFGFGYDSDLGPNAWIEVGTMNLLGLGKTGRLMLMGGGDITRAKAQYIDPRFLGSTIYADGLLIWNHERRPYFDLTQAEGKYSLTRKFPYKISGTLASRISWNRLSNVGPDYLEDITFEENTLWGIGPILIYDSRDDFIDPRTGWFDRVMIEYVREFLQGDQFLRFEGQVSRFMPVTERTVLAASFTYGHIEPLGSSEIPLQEVFFLGGARTVRGYSEDNLGPRTPEGAPTGGLDKVVANMELRFPIWSIFHGVLFIDSGQVVPRDEVLDISNQVYTVGTGLRLLTPVGPIRIDYGYKLEPVWWEERYRWHFSFGYPF